MMTFVFTLTFREGKEIFEVAGPRWHPCVNLSVFTFTFDAILNFVFTVTFRLGIGKPNFLSYRTTTTPTCSLLYKFSLSTSELTFRAKKGWLWWPDFWSYRTTTTPMCSLLWEPKVSPGTLTGTSPARTSGLQFFYKISFEFIDI